MATYAEMLETAKTEYNDALSNPPSFKVDDTEIKYNEYLKGLQDSIAFLTKMVSSVSTEEITQGL